MFYFLAGMGGRGSDPLYEPLYRVFIFWLDQLKKLFNVMKLIPIFGTTISLFHVFIGLATIGIMIRVVRFGLNSASRIRWLDSTVTYYNGNNPRGIKSFGKPR